MASYTSGIKNMIHSHGDRGAVVPFSRMDDLKEDMLELKNGAFHTSWLDRMTRWITESDDQFIPSDITFTPRSLISIIMPSPKALLRFQYEGATVDCVVPPHYTNWEGNNERALRYLCEYLSPLGFSAAMVRTLPHKLLAVHCGLGVYGRNNICYSDEFGSYMQIMTYLSDMPCDEETWFPIRRREMCENCSACVSACPTGAIDVERRLIDSDRCITLVNESPGEFPEWIGADAHNSITGCVRCQDCCPGNAKNADNIVKGIAFTQAETIEILNRSNDAPYSDAVEKKLAATGISPEFLAQLPRNLSALLNRRR